MAIYVWFGEEPEVVYVANKHRVRVERREKYVESPHYSSRTRRAPDDVGKWGQGT